MTSPIPAVYGLPLSGLAELPPGAEQCSPQVPGCIVLDDRAAGSCSSLVIAAPASTIERRAVLARALTTLVPGGALTVLAPNDKGGTRLVGELTAFGCTVTASHKSHHRIATTVRPAAPVGLDASITEGAPRRVPGVGLWSQPGLFSWDRIDPGSRLLLDHLPPLKGRGADLGCGIGVLAHGVLRSASVAHLTLIDLDNRALACAERNVADPRAVMLWADVRKARTLPTGLDFVVMNPPFHEGGAEDRAVGHAFITKAANMMRPGGTLWLTANRHLPYEATLKPLFKTVNQVVQFEGFKIYEAIR
jgi:16S rRNA (guanine1207-N2)-methyltransferase